MKLLQATPATPPPPLQPRILRLPEVMEITGLSKSQIYRLMEADEFPRHFKISPRGVGWLACEIYQWLLGKAGKR